MTPKRGQIRVEMGRFGVLLDLLGYYPRRPKHPHPLWLDVVLMRVVQMGEGLDLQIRDLREGQNRGPIWSIWGQNGLIWGPRDQGSGGPLSSEAKPFICQFM